ncbi:MAG: MFS transporter, partial [Propionibacteriaceae bacterium]|nr:MFS transporter [Propionibacteriaceae bacterium]
MTETTKERSKEWLTEWDANDPAKWDKSLANRTLAITTFSLTLCFVAWFLPSAIAPKLTNLGFDLTNNQLYWLTSMPGLAGGLLRLIWMILPPMMGTRKMVAVTSGLLLIPLIGWGVAVQNPNTPYWQLLVLAFMAGIGGGAFSGFMPSTSYFFPKSKSGTALGIQAGVGNFGVSLVQLATPWLIGFGMIGFLGSSQSMIGLPGQPAKEVWYQNAGFFYVPFAILAMILAWTMLKSVPVKANIREQ